MVGWGAFRQAALLLGLVAAFVIPSFGARDLWDPDEPRYMEVAREMVARGDYLVPHLNGRPYPDKPPLFFWVAAGLYKLGFGYDSGRLVAALASLGTVLVSYFLARRLLPEPGPLLAALCMLTSFLFLASSKMGVIDPLLAFLTTTSIFCGVRAMAQDASGRRGLWLLCYLLAGLAVLAKGPVGAILPAVVLASYRVLGARQARSGRWVHLAGCVLCLGTVAAWLVPALARGGEEYAMDILVKQNLGRVVQSFSHRNPFYYYLAYAPLIFLPWSLFLGPAVASGWRAWRREREPAAALGLAWFGSVFLFFSLMSGKRSGYLLPLMPAFGLLMGRYLLGGIGGRDPWPRLHRALSAATFGLVILGGLLLLAGVGMADVIALKVFPDDATLADDVADLKPGVLVGALPGVMAWTGLACWGWAVGRGGGRLREAGAVVGIMLVASLTLDAAVLPAANRFKSARLFVEAARPYLAQADRLFLYGSKFSGVYNLYTDRAHIPVLGGPDDLRLALLGPERVAVIGRDKAVLEALGRPPWPGRVAAESRVGHRKMLLLCNWPGPATDTGPGNPKEAYHGPPRDAAEQPAWRPERRSCDE